MPRVVSVDFSRPPNAKERAQLQTRRDRLVAMEKSVGDATAHIRTLAEDNGIETLRIRHPFVRLSSARFDELQAKQTLDGPSDRRLPSDEDRAPASRLVSPRGAALRFYLTTLFEAQSGTRRGQQPVNKRRIQAGADAISWTDLLASPAKPAVTGKTYMNVSAKKARQVKNALVRMAAIELVELTRGGQPGNKYEKFQLLHEGGHRQRGPNPPLHGAA